MKEIGESVSRKEYCDSNPFESRFGVPPFIDWGQGEGAVNVHSHPPTSLCTLHAVQPRRPETWMDRQLAGMN